MAAIGPIRLHAFDEDGRVVHPDFSHKPAVSWCIRQAASEGFYVIVPLNIQLRQPMPWRYVLENAFDSLQAYVDGELPL